VNTVGLFLDGSNRNTFARNLVADNGWGVILYSSSENNVFTGNAFVGNDLQFSLDMRRTRNRVHDGDTGNFWSDARPYDLDGDGRGDAPYSPVGFFGFISKQYPDLTVFAGSPAVVALDLAQRALPALQPSQLTDPHPLLHPVPLPGFAGPAPEALP
jgi:nitrous oxidase accessory protein